MCIFTTILKNSVYAQDFYTLAVGVWGKERRPAQLTPRLYSLYTSREWGADEVGEQEPPECQCVGYR